LHEHPYFVDKTVTGQASGGFVNDYVLSSHAYSRLGEQATCVGARGLSMAPALFPGNTVCYAPFNDSVTIIEGDVIIFEAEHGRTAHAVISRTNTEAGVGFVTKGYNNVALDPVIVTEENIVGVVTEVRYT
jgi:signal peptidase I